jgi:FeS assembly SUF system protein
MEDELSLKDSVISVLKTIFDPEIPKVSIYDLGLIYELEVDEELGKVLIDMTLTSPNCPVAESLPNEVKNRVRALPEVSHLELNIVWDPPWDPNKMSDAAKLELNVL